MRGTQAKKLRSEARNRTDYSFDSWLKTFKKSFKNGKKSSDSKSNYRHINGAKNHSTDKGGIFQNGKCMIEVKDSSTIKSCPKCGNNSKFTIQYGWNPEREYRWEIFAVCKCGNEIPEQKRFKGSSASFNDFHIEDAMEYWNKYI